MGQIFTSATVRVDRGRVPCRSARTSAIDLALTEPQLLPPSERVVRWTCPDLLCTTSVISPETTVCAVASTGRLYGRLIRTDQGWLGGREGSHLPAPTDPYVTVSGHTALIILIISQQALGLPFSAPIGSRQPRGHAVPAARLLLRGFRAH